MKTITSAVLFATTALMFAPSASFAQQSGSTTNAYVVGRDGTPLMNPRSGECVRTRFWTPAASHPRCGAAKAPAAASKGGRR